MIKIFSKEVSNCEDCPNSKRDVSIYECTLLNKGVSRLGLDEDCPLPTSPTKASLGEESLIFKSLHWVRVAGRGWLSVTKNNAKRKDFSDLMYVDVMIDGVPYKVKAVETFARPGVFDVGHPIALLIYGEPSKEIQETALRA